MLYLPAGKDLANLPTTFLLQPERSNRIFANTKGKIKICAREDSSVSLETTANKTQEQGEKSRGQPCTGTHGMQGRYAILLTGSPEFRSRHHPIRYQEKLRWSVLAARAWALIREHSMLRWKQGPLDRRQELAPSIFLLRSIR